MFDARVRIGNGLMWTAEKIRAFFTGLAMLCTAVLPIGVLLGVFSEDPIPVPFGDTGGPFEYGWQAAILAVGFFVGGRVVFGGIVVVLANLVYPNAHLRQIEFLSRIAQEIDPYEQMSEADRVKATANYISEHKDALFVPEEDART